MEIQPAALPLPTEKVALISINKFIFLNIITFNLYSFWWIYKSWQFFKDHDNSDIMPAVRVILWPFTLISLFYKIKEFAVNNGLREKYSSGLLFLSIIVTMFFSYLPGYLTLIAQIAFYFYLRPLAALNFAIKKCGRYDASFAAKFNTRQIVLIVCGSLLWVCVIISMVMGNFNER